MSPTLHKFLIHGPQIIFHALLPIGKLCEVAEGACTKDFKLLPQDVKGLLVYSKPSKDFDNDDTECDENYTECRDIECTDIESI